MKFGLVTEGETDQLILKYLLVGFFYDPDLVVRNLQPLRDETDIHDPMQGGWTETLKYCQSEIFKEAFQTNEYIIVQIDTDVAEETHFDVSYRDEHGTERTPEQLIEAVCQRLIDLMGREFYEKNQEKIIFAIAVHSIESLSL